MTNELEKQFFDTFGIEPEIFTGCKLEKNNRKEDTCPFEKDGIMELCHKVCKYAFTEREIYPQISDRMLLELFDILRKYYNLDFWTIDDSFVMDMRDKQASYTNIIYRTGGDLKHSILSSLQLIVNRKLNYNEKIKHQVRTLFEEG